MNVLYLLIPISFLLLAFAITGLVWSIRKGQYDDLDSPAHRILYDDDEDMMPAQKKRSNIKKDND